MKKQYITVDNSSILLYTVCKKGVQNMHFIVNSSSMIPIYEQLVDQVKQAIIAGELKENEALPSVRTLSGELRISALTVKKAYDHLEEDGFVVTVHGKGTFVAVTDRQMAAEARRRAVEENFMQAIQKAHLIGMDNGEIRDLISVLLEESV